MTAELVEEQIELVSYTVMPFTILGIKEDADGLTFNSVPFDSEFRMTAAPGPGPTLCLLIGVSLKHPLMIVTVSFRSTVM